MQKGAKKADIETVKLGVFLEPELHARVKQEARRVSVLRERFVPMTELVVEWIRERLSGKSKAA